LPLNCKVVEKRVLGPRFVGAGDAPDFGHDFSNRTHFYCVRFWLSSVQRSRWAADEKERTRKCGNYTDVLPLKAARRDSISNSTFLRLRIWAAKNNAVSFRVVVGSHVNAA